MAVTLVVALPVVQSASCSVHELVHASAGSALGWQVEAIDLCLLDGGSVSYSLSSGGVADDIESYAGGLTAGVLLALGYWWGLVRTTAPRSSPVWWMVGLVVAWAVGAQLLVGLLEGVVGPGEDYGDLFSDVPGVFIPLAVVAMAAGPAAHTCYWRPPWSA